MAATRAVLIKSGIIQDVGWISLIVTIAGVVGPLALHWAVMRSGWGTFLFVRPRAFHIDRPRSTPEARLQPAR
ncbi:hypothetical protein ACIKT0_05940 [Hansschlegelia beijingensis]|uniref:hypothetical protein n=1 Tax=Hansschlegelia beijingensis TaxID=1133344 RepID=UPI00387F2878